ncbi:endonuclease/exonuclease/phosphatase family protein [Propionibacteriaceae bacterium Y1685]
MTPIDRRQLIAGAGAVAAGSALAHTAAAASAHAARTKALIGKATRTQLHVMTFNIRLDRSTETQPGDPDHWPERKPIVTDVLALEQPTLLGVQEAKFAQLSAVEAGLPAHRMIGYGRQGGSHDEYSAIFFDAERVELLEWDQFWLSDTPQVIGSATWGNTVTRIVVWARLRDRNDGTEFAMINTHFDHQSEPARIKSADAMINLFNGGQLDGLPTIVTGDFNSSSHNSGAYSTLVTDGPMVDTWDGAEKRLTPEWNTFPAYKEPVAGGNRIDWVLATDDVRIRRAAINMYRNEAGRYPSDHAPVQALIELP